MNYNILAYLLFVLMISFIIGYAGSYFFRNGRIFIISLMNGQVSKADQLNRILLIAYYLFNIGYALLTLNSWTSIVSVEQMITSLADNIGLLILILAVTHYFNMAIIYFLSKNKTFTSTNKTFQL